MEYSQIISLPNSTKFSHLLNLKENSEIDTFLLCVLNHFTSQSIEPIFLESFVNKFSFEAGQNFQQLLVSTLHEPNNLFQQQNIKVLLKNQLLPQMKDILVEFLHKNNHIFLTNFWQIIDNLNEEKFTENIIELVCMVFDTTITIVYLLGQSQKVYLAKTDEYSLIYIARIQKIEGLLYIRQSIEYSDLFENQLDEKTPYKIENLEINQQKQLDYFKIPFKIIKNILKSISLQLKTRIDEQRIQELFEYQDFDFKILKILQFGVMYKDLLKQCRVLSCKNQAKNFLQRCGHKICQEHRKNTQYCPVCNNEIQTDHSQCTSKMDPKILLFRQDSDPVLIIHHWDQNRNLCFKCYQQFTYGTECKNCWLLYCSKCILKNIWEFKYHIQCLSCKQEVNIGDTLICQGCYELTYISMFVPLNTCSHFYLCKFCWYHQLKNQKCILDDNPISLQKIEKFKEEFKIQCFKCQNYELQYLERDFCPQNHLVCHKCQTQQIEQGEPKKCMACDQQLIRNLYFHPTKNTISSFQEQKIQKLTSKTMLEINQKNFQCQKCLKIINRCYTCQNCKKQSKLTFFCAKCFVDNVDQTGYYQCPRCFNRIDIPQPSVCQGCKKFKYKWDFVCINPCKHTEVCKECWYLQTNSRKCILDGNLISDQIIQDYIQEYSIQCENCQKKKIKYNSDKVCLNECDICHECQVQSNDYCIGCGKELYPK